KCACNPDGKTLRLSCCCFRVLERGKDTNPNFSGLYKVRNARISRLRFGGRDHPWNERKQKAGDACRRRYGPTQFHEHPPADGWPRSRANIILRCVREDFLARK